MPKLKTQVQHEHDLIVTITEKLYKSFYLNLRQELNLNCDTCERLFH